MVVNLSAAHSLVSNWIAELRDINVQNDRMRFRRNLERIGEIAAYEISKELPSVVVETKTPLGIHKSKVLAQQPVLATILRAGLLHELPFIRQPYCYYCRPHACNWRFYY